MNNNRKQIADIPTWVKFGIVVIILCGSNIAYTELRINMEKDQSFYRHYYIESRVKVSYNDADPIFIDLIRIDEIVESNDLTGDDRLTFEFLNSQLGLIANFSKVEIYFYIESHLWMKYDVLQANFFIEDKSGVIRKYDFEESKEGMPIYVGIHDVSSLMWKEAVPQEIRANVIFNNS